MKGREFIAVAERLSALHEEADWRSSDSRSYYGLYLECRETFRRWGFAIPNRGSHHEVGQRLKFSANPDLNAVATAFQFLVSLRNRADYDLTSQPVFANSKAAISAAKDARMHVAILDAIDADPARRAQAIADIRAAFP